MVIKQLFTFFKRTDPLYSGFTFGQLNQSIPTKPLLTQICDFFGLTNHREIPKHREQKQPTHLTSTMSELMEQWNSTLWKMSTVVRIPKFTFTYWHLVVKILNCLFIISKPAFLDICGSLRQLFSCIGVYTFCPIVCKK